MSSRITRLGEAQADLVELVEEGLLVADAVHHVPAHILRRIQLGLLREVADADPRERAGLAEIVVIHTRHDAEEGALARAVGAEDADLRAGIEREVDPLEDLLAGGHDLPEVAHREDVFAGHRDGKIDRPWRLMNRAPRARNERGAQRGAPCARTDRVVS
jgi:hypothetical protein